MTPEDKEKIRLNLIDYITGTVDEWLRLAHFDQTPEDRDGIQLRISWEHPTDGAMIAKLSELEHGDPIAQFGVQIIVDTLPDLPPIGPETDGVLLAEKSERVPEWKWDPDYPGCAPEECGGSRLDPCATIMRTHGRYHDGEEPKVEPAPEWTPATLSQCLGGDRIRIGTDETDVLSCSLGTWRADTRDVYRPVGWEHQELRMELAAVPGVQQYPPNAYCEILCTPERKAVLTLQMTFPGSAVISSDVD